VPITGGLERQWEHVPVAHADDFTGALLTGVAASWHQDAGVRDSEPLHVWLTVEGHGSYRFHTSGDGSLEVSAGVPHLDYDMERYGEVAVEPGTPLLLGERLGQRIEGVSRLRQDPPGAEVGVVLHFPVGAVAVANLGDDLIVGTWPADAWSAAGVTEVV
jgi:hypothetical protein